MKYLAFNFLIAIISQFNSCFASTIQHAIVGSNSALYEYACRDTFNGRCSVTYTPQFDGVDHSVKDRRFSSLYAYRDTLATSTSASVSVDQDLLLPVLKARASVSRTDPVLPPNPDPTRYTGTNEYIADTNVWATEHFKYTGLNATTLYLRAYATTSFSKYGEPTQDIAGHSWMNIGAFTSSDFNFDRDGICAIGGFSDCATHATLMGNVSTYLDPTAHNILELIMYLKPGQEFYVGGYLDADVRGIGMVDTSHTMHMEFSDVSNLELLDVPGVALSEVPEPASLALTLLGLLTILALAGRNMNTRSTSASSLPRASIP